MLPQVQRCVYYKPEPEGPPDGDMDSCIQHRFMDIFNDVFDFFGLGKMRKALATQSTDDERDDNYFDYNKLYLDTPHFSTRPDLVMLGQDARLLPRAVDTYTRSMSVDLYRGCVAIGKVQRFIRWGGIDVMVEKVATCARYVNTSGLPLG